KKLTKLQRMVRDRAFKRLVCKSYDARCALCGQRLQVGKKSLVEGAHIAPRSQKGTDDPRNGLGLCRNHHWSFDRGLWTVGPAGLVSLANTVLRTSELAQYAGHGLAKPSKHDPHPSALAWHREICFKG